MMLSSCVVFFRKARMWLGAAHPMPVKELQRRSWRRCRCLPAFPGAGDSLPSIVLRGCGGSLVTARHFTLSLAQDPSFLAESAGRCSPSLMRSFCISSVDDPSFASVRQLRRAPDAAGEISMLIMCLHGPATVAFTIMASMPTRPSKFVTFSCHLIPMTDRTVLIATR